MKRLMLAACTLVALNVAAPVSAQQPVAADGKAVFEANCKGCHGPRGIPSPAMVKMMDVPRLDAAYFAKHTDDSVVVALTKGRGKMKAFSPRLTADQIVAVARYMRGLVTAPS